MVPDLFRLEAALDRAYARRALEGPGRGGDLLAFVREEIDLRNAWSILTRRAPPALATRTDSTWREGSDLPCPLPGPVRHGPRTGPARADRDLRRRAPLRPVPGDGLDGDAGTAGPGAAGHRVDAPRAGPPPRTRAVAGLRPAARGLQPTICARWCGGARSTLRPTGGCRRSGRSHEASSPDRVHAGPRAGLPARRAPRPGGGDRRGRPRELSALRRRPEVGIVLVEQGLFEALAEDERAASERGALPVVVPFPGPEWARAEDRRGLRGPPPAPGHGYRVRLR